MSCTQARGLAYAAVFMALQTHSVLPHSICLLVCCVFLCVSGCVRYEVGNRGVSPSALCLALFRHFQLEGVVSVETDLNFKPIWGWRENDGWVWLG